MTIKIEAMHSDLPQPVAYANVFAREEVGGVPRLRVGVDEAQDAAVAALAESLCGTGAELGRYESPELTLGAVQDFLRRFGRFLCEDSRHDLWIRSHDDDATVVLDRHNLIYGYGPLNDFERVLQSLGVRQGESPLVPDPHLHHYHQVWDGAEREIVRRFDWHIKPLRTADVQFEAGR